MFLPILKPILEVWGPIDVLQPRGEFHAVAILVREQTKTIRMKLRCNEPPRPSTNAMKLEAAESREVVLTGVSTCIRGVNDRKDVGRPTALTVD